MPLQENPDSVVPADTGSSAGLRLPIADNGFLRPLDVGDVTSAYVDGLNDPDVNRFMVTVRKQRQDEDMVKAYVAADRDREDAILFGVFIDDGLRGTVRIHHMDRATGIAHVGIVLFDRAYWGGGWGSRALRAATEFGLRSLGLNRIVGGIYEANAASQKSFSRAGFRHDPSMDEQGDIDLIRYWVAERNDGLHADT